MLEANLELCEVMTTNTRKVSVDRLREIKRIYSWAEEEYIDFRTANKKLHIKQLMAQAEDFLKKVREANFVQRVSVDKQLSLKEVIERLKIKKTVAWAEKELLIPVKEMKIDFSDKVSEIQTSIDKAKAWKPDSSDILDWVNQV